MEEKKSKRENDERKGQKENDMMDVKWWKALRQKHRGRKS
jgi:hypothetical protein